MATLNRWYRPLTMTANGMHRIYATLIFFWTLAFSWQLLHAGTISPIEFSADVFRWDAKVPNQVSQGKMKVGKSGVRTESTRQNQTVWMIFRPDLEKVFTLFPEQKVYAEKSGLALGRPPLPDEAESPCRSIKTFDCKQVGQEKMQNRDTTVWVIAERLPQGLRPYAKLWVDPRLKIAIREEYADGLAVELRNLVEAEQSAGLFAIPEKFRKMDPLVPPQPWPISPK